MTVNDISAVILAGGKSSRMGVNKMLLPLGNGTIISNTVDALHRHFDETIIVTDQPHLYRDLSTRLTGDVISCTVKNSLVGIHGGLFASSSHHSLIVAGDMPFLSAQIIQYLDLARHGYDVVMPKQGTHCQPLCAIYSKNCIPVIEKQLSSGCYKITDILPSLRVRYIELDLLRFFDPELITFFNINSPQDYMLARMYVEKPTKYQKKPELQFR